MMPEFRVVEARPYYIGRIVRTLRLEHGNVLVRMGVNAHRQLDQMYDQSSFRRAWMIDGQLSGLGGVTGSTASGSGYIWLALSQASLKYPAMILKTAREQLAEIMQSRSELMTSILCADGASERFARHLGFSAEGERKGIGGQLVQSYTYRPA